MLLPKFSSLRVSGFAVGHWADPMQKPIQRRTFLKTAATAGVSAVLAENFAGLELNAAPAAAGKPIVISSANGLKATAKAMELIKQGKDAIDAVVAGVSLVEADPKDNSVGYGGLPNEEGVVELDASVMHGPTGRGGAVAAWRNIMHPSQVARTGMERSDHVLIVGEGALKFAKAHGFKEQDLLTDESRAAWLKWKENLSTEDDWLPPHDVNTKGIGKVLEATRRHYGTINCSAIDLAGNISSCTTTSGLSFKIPGRVGDSPILGAGLYVDNEVGAAGSTGRGEANLYNLCSFLIVEEMRRGAHPKDAGMAALRRVAKNTTEKRLLNAKNQPNFGLNFYVISARGEYAGVSMQPAKYAVCTDSGAQTLDTEALF